MEECLKRFVVIFASERVGVSFCSTTKVFKEGYDGGIVIVEQTRRWHTAKSGGQILGLTCPLSSLSLCTLDWSAVHFLAVVLAFQRDIQNNFYASRAV